MSGIGGKIEGFETEIRALVSEMVKVSLGHSSGVAGVAAAIVAAVASEEVRLRHGQEQQRYKSWDFGTEHIVRERREPVQESRR